MIWKGNYYLLMRIAALFQPDILPRKSDTNMKLFLHIGFLPLHAYWKSLTPILVLTIRESNIQLIASHIITCWNKIRWYQNEMHGSTAYRLVHDWTSRSELKLVFWLWELLRGWTDHFMLEDNGCLLKIWYIVFPFLHKYFRMNGTWK